MTQQMERPTELQSENLPPTQSCIGKIFFSEIPKSIADFWFTDTATKCFSTSFSDAVSKNQFLTKLALARVSSVVKLFETTMNSVVSGLRCCKVSATISPSMLAIK